MIDLKKIGKVARNIKKIKASPSIHDYSGDLRSKYKGNGIQFKEHFLYVPGDDTRFIDWNLSAKTQKTYIKTFEEERNLDIHVFLDITESMFLLQDKKSKLEAYLESIILLYLIFQKTKDNLSVHIFFDKVYDLESTNGFPGIGLFLNFCKKLNIVNDYTVSSFKKIKELKDEMKINEIKKVLQRKKEVILFSDFLSLSPMMEKILHLKQVHPFSYYVEIEKYSQQPIKIKTKELIEIETHHVKKNQEKLIRSILLDSQYLESLGHFL